MTPELKGDFIRYLSMLGMKLAAFVLVLAACAVPADSRQWDTTRQGWPVLTLQGNEGLSRDEISHRARVKKVEADMVDLSPLDVTPPRHSSRACPTAPIHVTAPTAGCCS